jgi:hypothetical protein
MAQTLYLMRKMNALYASDGLAGNDLAKLPEGVRFKAVLTRPRSVPHHRLYWAVLALVVDNCEGLRDKEQLHDLIKIRLRYCDPVKSKKTGEVWLIPRSASFEKMGQSAFNEYFDDATRFICDEIIPGLGKAELLAQAREMLGIGEQNDR